MEWWTEPNAEYLVERSPDSGDGSRSWTRLSSTCEMPENGMWAFLRPWEDGKNYPAIIFTDVNPGLQLEKPYAYRLTIIRDDGTAGSTELPYTPSSGMFSSAPLAAVNGHTVRVAADQSFCTLLPGVRCDPWMMEVTVTSSSSGYSYTSQQLWANSYDPSLPITVPGGIEGTFVFTITGVPPGTHSFTLTALYQPNFRVAAGTVTVQVP